MKTMKKLILIASVISAIALFSGCAVETGYVATGPVVVEPFIPAPIIVEPFYIHPHPVYIGPTYRYPGPIRRIAPEPAPRPGTWHK